MTKPLPPNGDRGFVAEDEGGCRISQARTLGKNDASLIANPRAFRANGFQDFLRNPTLTQNNRKYQTVENAENPVKSRAFGVFPFPKTETSDGARNFVSKTISKTFLEKLLDKSAQNSPVASHDSSAKSATTD